jgi:MarR family transcriptional regulator, lower aerobic nicotinate degradation pathway regulator
MGTAMANDDSRFLEKPGHLIRRLQQIALALFMDQTGAFGITPVQYSAIIAISNHPGIDQTALCNVIAFDRSTIGGVVGRLEKKKLIKRLNGARDRRTKSLHITPAGRRLLGRIEPAVQTTQRLILAPLKPAERVAFMGMLKHLVHLNNEHSRAPFRPKAAQARR